MVVTTIISNKLFESIIDQNKPILYIQLAMEPHRYDDCLAWINGDEFSNIKHGEFVMVRDMTEIQNHNLGDYAAIFIGGGNTYHLLQRLKDSSAFQQIKEYLDNCGVVSCNRCGRLYLADQRMKITQNTKNVFYRHWRNLV